MANIVVYETPQGKVELSPEIIRRYLVNGNGKVTDQEVMMFLQLCRYQKLNPFLREAYLIKYGDEPATIVTGKETFTKRAASIPDCNGWIAGVVVLKDGKIVYRPGSLVLKDEKLVGTPNRQWRRMPGTMIRKVALVQALREAFPTEFGGLYSPEEMAQAGVDMDELPQAEIVTPEPEKKEETPRAKEENTVEEVSPPPKEKSHPKEPSSLQKQVLNLWKELGLAKWHGESIESVVEKANDKKLKAMVEWAKKKLAEKELKEHKEAQTEKLRKNILELALRITPTNEELENIGIEDTGISLEDELKRYDYSKLRQIEKKLEAMLKK